jgi:hypothetical protein
MKGKQHFYVGPYQKRRIHVLRKVIFILSLAVAASATSAFAASFTGLCDTGVTAGCATQTPLGANAIDTNFTVTVTPSVGTPPFASHTIASNPGYYTSGGNGIGTATASWITTATGTTPVDATAVGTYNYQEAILATTTGLVAISGDWAVDNCGTIAWGATPVAVVGGTGTTIGNGVGASCATSVSTFNVLTPFSIQESVTAGTTYYLDFEVGNTGNVTGLLVDGLSSTAASSTAPEPSTLPLLAAGFALLGGGIMRKRNLA